MQNEINDIILTWKRTKQKREDSLAVAESMVRDLDETIELRKEEIAMDIIVSKRNPLEREGKVFLFDKDFTLFAEGKIEQKGFDLENTYNEFKANNIKGGKNFCIGSTTESPHIQGIFLDERFIRYVLKEEFVKLGFRVEASRSGAFELFIK